MEIKKGMRFRCIKDVVIKTVINPCAKEYIEGREYISMNDNAITNEWGDIRRKWTNKIENHFELTESKPMNYDLEKTVVHCTTQEEFDKVIAWHINSHHELHDETNILNIHANWNNFKSNTVISVNNILLYGNIINLADYMVVLPFSQFERDFLNKKVAEQPEPSVKNDFKDNKLRWDLLPLDLIEELVKVYDYGAKKYYPESWKEIPDGYKRLKAASLRHLVAFEKGEEIDPESGLPHLIQASWNLLTSYYYIQNADKDN